MAVAVALAAQPASDLAALAGPPRSVLLVTIDTLRADYLSCNGSSKVATPHLDRLAREGVNFTRARSPVPLTLPAHASILTGNYPPRHGVRDNGAYRLPDSQLSLAEVLRRQGYLTAAFLASFVLDRRFGLGQGFEHYDDRVWDDPGELESLEAERSAEEVVEAFGTWLSGVPHPQPFFAWVHLYDPHAPYLPPEPYRSRFPQDPYAGEVAYTDAAVGQLVARLLERGPPSEVVVAVVGDHGEGLGEHGEGTHSLLIYNSTLHVPMLVWSPGLVPADTTVTALVRIIDLAPTLLDLLGLEARLGQGMSLRPLFQESSEGSPPVEALTAYSESLYAQLHLGWSALRGLETTGHRLIAAPRLELYDLGDDPGETRNLLAVDPRTHQSLLQRLQQQLEAVTEEPAAAAAQPLDEASIERLRSLGYLSGSSRSPVASRTVAVDPKDRLAVWQRLQVGIEAFVRSDFRAATENFGQALEEDPQLLLAYEYLGASWQRLSELDRAEKIYREALQRGLESSDLHAQLGRIYLQRGQLRAAERRLDTAVALDPRNASAHYHLADVYRLGEQPAPAVEHYRAAIEINPDYLWAWNGLGMALASLGRGEEALRAFRRVVDIEPREARAHFNLAVQLERAGSKAEARAAYRRFLELSAGSADLESQRRRAEAALTRLNG